MKKLQKGFTLIELLVVIAIIGILSSVVLASLTSARTKGSDSALQATLSNMRAQAELYYGTNNTYSTATACTGGNAGGIFESATSSGSLRNLITDAIAKEASSTGSVSCQANGTAWAVSAPLSTGAFCVDSAGNAIATGTLPSSIYACR